MADHRHVPSPAETLEVVRQLEALTSEAQRLSEQLTQLARTESAPRPNQRRNKQVPQAGGPASETEPATMPMPLTAPVVTRNPD